MTLLRRTEQREYLEAEEKADNRGQKKVQEHFGVREDSEGIADNESDVCAAVQLRKIHLLPSVEVEWEIDI